MWSTRNLLWLPILFWVTLALGIAPLHTKELNAYFRELKKDVEELYNEEDEK